MHIQLPAHRPTIDQADKSGQSQAAVEPAPLRSDSNQCSETADDLPDRRNPAGRSKMTPTDHNGSRAHHKALAAQQNFQRLHWCRLGHHARS